jgi:hypothetical protein
VLSIVAVFFLNIRSFPAYGYGVKASLVVRERKTLDRVKAYPKLTMVEFRASFVHYRSKKRIYASKYDKKGFPMKGLKKKNKTTAVAAV